MSVNFGTPLLLVLTAALGLTDCRTVPPATTDSTPPIVKLDIYGVTEFGENVMPFSDCCTLRRHVGRADPLTLVASAEDAESGSSSVEIVATVISECIVTRSFRGSRGVPDGPPVGRVTLRQTERVLRSNTASVSPFPRTLLVNANTRLGDLEPERCLPIKFALNDDPPSSVPIAEQSTTFCGVRIFARGKNGTGGTKSTATALLMEGAPRSGTVPCASVPF